MLPKGTKYEGEHHLGGDFLIIKFKRRVNIPLRKVQMRCALTLTWCLRSSPLGSTHFERKPSGSRGHLGRRLRVLAAAGNPSRRAHGGLASLWGKDWSTLIGTGLVIPNLFAGIEFVCRQLGRP